VEDELTDPVSVLCDLSSISTRQIWSACMNGCLRTLYIYKQAKEPHLCTPLTAASCSKA
jgi:hypothetical protein